MKTALRIIALALAALLAATGLTAVFLSLWLFKAEDYEKYILTEDFYLSVLKERDENISSLGVVIALDENALHELIPDETCKTLAAEYVRAVLSDLINGGNRSETVSFSSEELRAYIFEILKDEDYSDSTEYKDAAEAAQGAYEMLTANVDAAFCFMPHGDFAKIQRAATALTVKASFSYKLWFVYFLLSAALFTAAWFLGLEKSASRRVFELFGAVWCGVMLLFVPAVIFFFSNPAPDLGRTPFYYFFYGCISNLRISSVLFTLAAFVPSTALLVFSIFRVSSRNFYAEPPEVAYDEGGE